LAGAFGALQHALSTTGLWAHRRRRSGGAGSAALQRSGALAGFVHSAPVGTPATVQLVLLGEGWRHRRPLFVGATIVAWDLDAVCRILPFEARSP